jgi:hypothetical protein
MIFSHALGGFLIVLMGSLNCLWYPEDLMRLYPRCVQVSASSWIPTPNSWSLYRGTFHASLDLSALPMFIHTLGVLIPTHPNMADWLKAGTLSGIPLAGGHLFAFTARRYVVLN